jgi:hypothetical protein
MVHTYSKVQSTIYQPTMSHNSNTSSQDLSPTVQRQRRVLLDAVKRDARKAWSNLSEAQRREKEFVLAALTSESLPSKNELERAIPQSLRFDRDVVLAWVSRPDFEELYYQRHLYPPGCLTGDKEVMMKYCRKIPRSLQECSEELCNNYDVVKTAVTLQGLELQYASSRLQQDESLVRLACQTQGKALEYCPPGQVRTRLTSDKEFMRTVLRNEGGPMLKLCNEEMRHDPELLLEALTNGMHVRDVPKEIWNNRSFLVQAIQRNATLYTELVHTTPQELHSQHSLDLAIAAVTAPNATMDIFKMCLRNCPSLSQNRQAVLAICQHTRDTDKEWMTNLLESSSFSDDKEIMMAAVLQDCRLFASASERLRQDVDILLASITDGSAWTMLKTIAWSVQRENPEITAKCIKHVNLRNLRYVPAHVPEEAWQQRCVCLEWIRRGGRIMEAIERQLDTELSLAIAEHNWSEFHKCGETLLGDKDFILQAVQRDGRVLRFASREIQQDFWVVAQAVANHKDSLPLPHGMSLSEFSTALQQKLDLQKTFMIYFLRGIAIPSPTIAPALRSPLNLLDKGQETSEALKKLIAEYLGVPIGAQLKLLRTAQNVLNSPRVHREESETLLLETATRFAARDAPLNRARLFLMRRARQEQQRQGQQQAQLQAHPPQRQPGLPAAGERMNIRVMPLVAAARPVRPIRRGARLPRPVQEPVAAAMMLDDIDSDGDDSIEDIIMQDMMDQEEDFFLDD